MTRTSATPGTTWIAAHRTAVIDPHEAFKLFEVRGFADQTVRQTIRPAGEGEAFRVRLTNRYGTQPLTIGGAHIARRATGSGINPTTDTTLLFEGAETITIPPGEEIVSDPVEQAVTAGEELTLSLHLPEDTGLTTLAERLRTAGLTVIGSTVGPYADTVYPGYDTEEGQAIRHQVNTWLLGDTHPFDAIVDVAAAVADRTNPTGSAKSSTAATVSTSTTPAPKPSPTPLT